MATLDAINKPVTAMIAGPASKINEAVVIALARAGFEVFYANSSPENSERIASEISRIGGQCNFIDLSLHDPASIKSAIGRLIDGGDGFKVLVNNTLEISSYLPAVEINQKTWNDALDPALSGSFFLCQKFAKSLLDSRQQGHIINICSALGKVGMKGFLTEGIIAAGIIQFTRYIAAELGEAGILANSILVGSMENLHHEWFADNQQVEKKVPVGYLGSENCVADAVIFLANPNNNFMTGQELIIDGGLSSI